MTTVFANAVTIVVRKYYQQEIQVEKGPHPKEHDALIPPTKLENKNKKTRPYAVRLSNSQFVSTLY